MKNFSLSLIFFLTFTLPAFSQSREADSLYKASIAMIDSGELDNAWKTLEAAYKKYPKLSAFRYEQAYIRMLQERYKDAVKIMEEILHSADSYDRYYQLLGNSYDLSGNSKKAVETYKEGLEKYPESGVLNLELGVMSAQEEDYDQAMEYWENGLTGQPKFPSNYFHAARMFMATTERGWGHLYAEIFLNMEPGSDRSMAMRRMLWQSYNDAIILADNEEGDEGSEQEEMETSKAGASAEFKFFQNVDVVLDNESKKLLFPFSIFYERAASIASISLIEGGHPLTIAKLHTFRSSFLDQWYQDTATAEHFNIALYDYQRRLRDAGLFEVYDYYLFFCEETADEVREWMGRYPGKLEELANWVVRNPYPVSQDKAFSRLKLKGITMDAADFGEKVKVDDIEE